MSILDFFSKTRRSAPVASAEVSGCQRPGAGICDSGVGAPTISGGFCAP